VSLARAIVVSLRPFQWVKNLVVLVALGFSKHLFHPDAAARAALAFAVFCALASAVYLVNDILDLERDRLHPLKRSRPIASGALPVGVARIVALVLLLGALAGSLALGPRFEICAGSYAALGFGYSLLLKHFVILDVLTVALGFVLRAVAGAVAIGVHFSPWLLVCTILLALFLGLAKRRHELVSLDDAAAHRSSLAEYTPYLLDQMIAVVTASCLTAYAFYTTAQETREKFHTGHLSWTIPFVLYGIFRYLYLLYRRELGGNPSDLLLSDRALLANTLLWMATLVVIIYGPMWNPAWGR